ncbi:DUF2157 domain-containing protein [Shinella zoogloeoides]|uniref:DUF2157 domain-containing protein n=1 Tax=Shinella zoogloeoides TaxID=352475 RepID=A0A6N8T7C0_SHIZO|nr:DUF2157 domain-containing protein [Shinella zoogloeoides]MXN99161.1 DUF2157 domain-containing protein [Shinella zoogloeoides]UEX83052.1 DUF2157 domain-containing protein [Shinella zoogloeoides]
MYRGRLERDLKLWATQGLIDAQTAGRLLKEYDSRESAFSVGRVLMMIAALLVAAAVLLLVAANWDAVPRLARLVGILALIWGAYLAGGFLIARGAERLAAAFLVLGTLAFGGAIALVGQMYHLSGDTFQAMLVWFAGAVVAAALFRSGAVTAVAGVLAFVVAGVDWTQSSNADETVLLWLMPLMAAIVILLVRYSGADRVRHLAYLLLVVWLAYIYGENETPGTAIAIAVFGAVAYLLAAVPQSPLHALARSAGAAPAFYSYLVLLLGLLVLHAEFNGVADRLLVGIVTLGAAIAGIALSGKENGAVRYLGYAAFAAETLYLASETIGSIIGTSGFFLIAGFVVALIAWAVIVMERRFSRTEPKVEA